MHNECLHNYVFAVSHKWKMNAHDRGDAMGKSTCLMTVLPIIIYDPVQRHFGYGQLWPVMAITASVQPESGQII